MQACLCERFVFIFVGASLPSLQFRVTFLFTTCPKTFGHLVHCQGKQCTYFAQHFNWDWKNSKVASEKVNVRVVKEIRFQIEASVWMKHWKLGKILKKEDKSSGNDWISYMIRLWSYRWAEGLGLGLGLIIGPLKRWFCAAVLLKRPHLTPGHTENVPDDSFMSSISSNISILNIFYS